MPTKEPFTDHVLNVCKIFDKDCCKYLMVDNELSCAKINPAEKELIDRSPIACAGDNWEQLVKAKAGKKYPWPSNESVNNPEVSTNDISYKMGQSVGYIDALNDVKGLVEALELIKNHGTTFSSKIATAAIEQFEKIEL